MVILPLIFFEALPLVLQKLYFWCSGDLTSSGLHGRPMECEVD